MRKSTLVVAISLSVPLCFASETESPLKVTVYGDKIESHMDDSIDLRTISKQEILSSGATTLLDLLRQFGAVTVGQSYTGNKRDNTIAMGGFGENASQNMLIVLDGTVLNFATTESVDLGNIPLNRVTQIDIIRGAASVLYGEGAVGGVINIRTDVNYEPTLSIGASAGTYNSTQAFLRASQSLSENLFVDFSGNIHKSENHRPNVDTEVHNSSLTLAHDIRRGQIAYKYSSATSDQGLPGSVEYPSPADRANKKLVQHSFYLKQNLTDERTLYSNFSALKSQQNTLYALYPPASQQTTTKNSASLTLDQSWSSAKLTSGVDISRDNFDDGASATQKTQSLFSHFTLNSTEKWQYSAGTRWTAVQDRKSDSDTNSDEIWTAYLGSRYRIDNVTDLSGRLDRASRFASLDELNASSPRFLKPQITDSFSVKLERTEGRINWDISYTESVTSDEIYFDVTDTTGSVFGTNVNVDKTTRKILRGSLNTQVSETANLGFSASQTVAKYNAGTYAGKEITWIPEHQANIFASINLTHGWSVQFDTSYTGSMYYADDYRNAKPKINDYFISNLSLSYNIPNVDVGLRIDNLFDKDYLSFAQSYGSYPAPGRAFTLSFIYTF